MEGYDCLSNFNKKVEITPLFVCSIDKDRKLFKSYGDININKKDSDIFIESSTLYINENPASNFSKISFNRLVECIDKVICSNSLEEKVDIYIGNTSGKWYEIDIKKDINNENRAILVWFDSFKEFGNNSLNESKKSKVLLQFKDYKKKTQNVNLENIIRRNKTEIDNIIKKEKMKTEFFADVSHELRTPLNVILGAIQLLNFQMNKGSGLSENVKLDEYLSVIRFNALRLLRLVNNIIDLTKLDSGYNELQLKRCNIVSFVEEITNSVIPCMESKGITLTFDTDEEEIFTLMDPSKMERVILNLLSNAIKFTPQGGNVFVSIIHGDNIKICVKDSGIGMDNDKVNFIFERFKQINNGYTKSGEGSGIGLSLAKSIIEQHGGDINVESALGKGSKFTIVLPKNNINIDNDEFSLYEFQKEVVELELSDIHYKK